MNAASQRAFGAVAVSATSGDTVPLGATYWLTFGWAARYSPRAAQLVCATDEAGTSAAPSAAVATRRAFIGFSSRTIIGVLLHALAARETTETRSSSHEQAESIGCGAARRIAANQRRNRCALF